MRQISKNQNDMHRYDDLLDFHYQGSKNRKHMSMAQRAAQFAPFDALSGYKEALHESSRLTLQKVDLSEEECESIQLVLQQIQAEIHMHPRICVTFFVEDETKEGGRYEQVEKCVKKIEQGNLVFMDRTWICLDDIMHIEKAS